MKLELPELEQDKIEIPDLRRLKELSDRLQLSPKRQSVIQWKNDLKELQTEGLYPIPIKASKCSPLKKISESPPNIPAISISETLSGSENKFHINEDEEKCERNQDKNISKDVSGKQAFLRKHQNRKYFQQRSSEDCQRQISQYLFDENVKSEADEENKHVTIGERYKIIGLALERIRTDLLNMRIQDNNLARNLLNKREELNQVKAEKTWDEHANMLEDFTSELELEEELAEQLRSSDLSSTFLLGPDSLLRGSSPLRLIGISRMTLDAKRFSVI